MSWSTGEQRALSIETQQVLGTYGGQTQVLQAWQQKAADLEALKAQEMQLRKAAFELYFAAPVEGTNRTELGGGWSLKGEYKFNYSLTNKNGATEKAYDDITAISQQAGFVADRLFSWQPELSIKEYRLLNPDNASAQTEEQKKILAVLQKVLTIKPGAPTLTIEQPKAK